MTTDSDLNAAAAQAVQRLHVITAQIADLSIEADTIKATLRKNLSPGTWTIGGQPVMRITPQRRFDPALAEQTLPTALLELCLVRKVDGPTAKRMLPPATYDALMVETGEPRVSLL